MSILWYHIKNSISHSLTTYLGDSAVAINELSKQYDNTEIDNHLILYGVKEFSYWPLLGLNLNVQRIIYEVVNQNLYLDDNEEDWREIVYDALTIELQQYNLSTELIYSINIEAVHSEFEDYDLILGWLGGLRCMVSI